MPKPRTAAATPQALDPQRWRAARSLLALAALLSADTALHARPPAGPDEDGSRAAQKAKAAAARVPGAPPLAPTPAPQPQPVAPSYQLSQRTLEQFAQFKELASDAEDKPVRPPKISPPA